MSPFDIAVFAVPNSLIKAIFCGPSCIAPLSVMAFAMFSPVQLIILAEAEPVASAATAIVTTTNGFLMYSSLGFSSRFSSLRGTVLPNEAQSSRSHKQADLTKCAGWAGPMGPAFLNSGAFLNSRYPSVGGTIHQLAG